MSASKWPPTSNTRAVLGHAGPSKSSGSEACLGPWAKSPLRINSTASRSPHGECYSTYKTCSPCPAVRDTKVGLCHPLQIALWESRQHVTGPSLARQTTKTIRIAEKQQANSNDTGQSNIVQSICVFNTLYHSLSEVPGQRNNDLSLNHPSQQRLEQHRIPASRSLNTHRPTIVPTLTNFLNEDGHRRTAPGRGRQPQ